MDLTPTTIVNFRTLANGSYRYMRGLRRGYYRLLDVRDPLGHTRITSHNVIRQIDRTPNGIEGVTARSAYYLGSAVDRLQARADTINASRAEKFNWAVHHAE